GSVDATVMGGVGQIQYSWTDESDMVIATTEDVSLLSAGTYTLTVTDSLGCSSFCTITISEPEPIGANNTELTECEIENGEAVFDLTSTKNTVNGGVGLTYTYYEDM